MFRLSQVSFSVGEKQIVSPLDLEFAPGKIYGLVGHNGSGKSTLIKLLARQLHPTKGQITFQGEDISQFKSRIFSQNVAYLPQYLPQSTNQTCQQLVEMGRYPWQGLFGRTSTTDLEICSQMMALTHTSQFAEQLVDNLSGGERSRVWLAMMLAQQSKLLLLDEPLAALDINHQVEVMNLIKKLVQELGLGVIIVIHDLNLAARFCDEIIALKSGKLFFQGSPEQFMHPDTLESIYGIRLQVEKHPIDAVPIAFY